MYEDIEVFLLSFLFLRERTKKLSALCRSPNEIHFAIEFTPLTPRGNGHISYGIAPVGFLLKRKHGKNNGPRVKPVVFLNVYKIRCSLKETTTKPRPSNKNISSKPGPDAKG